MASAPRSWILSAAQPRSATGYGKRRRFPARDAKWPLPPLSHNEFVRPDVETRAQHRHGMRVIHCRCACLEDQRPQLGEVPAGVVKIRKTVPAKDSLADLIPSPGQSSAK